MNPRTFFLLVSPLLLAAALFALARVRPGVPSLHWDDSVRTEVQEIVGDRYLDALGPDQERELFDAAMRGYVGGLDPFSRYFTAAERQDLDEDTSGSFAGVGVQVRAIETGLLVSAVYRDGPADTAGLEPGDVVTRVDETDVVGMPLEQTISHVKGPDGSRVTLWTRRDGAEPVPYEVTRGIVGLDTVPAVHFLPGPARGSGVAYVRVSQFSESTPDEVRSGLEALIAEHDAGAIVLDLRQNLGGVVSAAVDLAGLFLPRGSTVCLTRSRNLRRRYAVGDVDHVSDDPAPFEQPLVVLVDAGSASASEILAGALQDHGRAVLVGERTYGKFLVQTLLPLESSEALVRITTARYETPRGRSGQRNERERARGGIMPDVRVSLDAESRADVFRAFRAQAGPRWRVLGDRNGEPSPMDVQLDTALDLLRGSPPPEEPIEVATVERG